MRKVRELTLKLVRPLLAMEKIVSKSPDNHHHREEPIARIGVASIEDRLDDTGLVCGAQMEVRKVVREAAVDVIALLKIGQLGAILVGTERVRSSDGRYRLSFLVLEDGVGFSGVSVRGVNVMFLGSMRSFRSQAVA